jgi:hypothetical protein
MPLAQLRYAPLPFIGAVAVHYWFVSIDDSGARHRWEVWQTRNAGGRSIGHVHCDLKPPDEGVGGGPARLAAEWHGAEAAAIIAVLERSSGYPHCERYRYWPGPNSNTFVAWVLREAGIRQPLVWKAFGKRYRA